MIVGQPGDRIGVTAEYAASHPEMTNRCLKAKVRDNATVRSVVGTMPSDVR